MRTECSFCDVEHSQGECLKQPLSHFEGGIVLHAMRPDITFIEE